MALADRIDRLVAALSPETAADFLAWLRKRKSEAA